MAPCHYPAVAAVVFGVPKLIPPPDDPNGIAGAEAAVDEALPNPPNDGAAAAGGVEPPPNEKPDAGA